MPTPRRLWPAFTASVAAHGLILALLLSVKFPSPPLPVTAREHVLISFARRPSLTPSREENAASALPASSSSPPAPSLPSPSPASLRVRGNDGEGEGIDEGAADASASVDGTALQAQISAFVLQQHDSYTQDFVEDCWIERQEGERRDYCNGALEGDKGGDAQARAQVTALFRDLNRKQRHAQVQEQLEARDERLKQLVADGGVLGALAAERRGIDHEYRAYLNGNRNTAASNFVMNRVANTGGNTQALGGFLQFICKKMPCIYEFTGFTVVKPRELEEAAAKADTFPYTPTLFGSRK
jgi:hypothetical protein